MSLLRHIIKWRNTYTRENYKLTRNRMRKRFTLHFLKKFMNHVNEDIMCTTWYKLLDKKQRLAIWPTLSLKQKEVILELAEFQEIFKDVIPPIELIAKDWNLFSKKIQDIIRENIGYATTEDRLENKEW